MADNEFDEFDDDQTPPNKLLQGIAWAIILIMFLGLMAGIALPGFRGG